MFNAFLREETSPSDHKKPLLDRFLKKMMEPNLKVAGPYH